MTVPTLSEWAEGQYESTWARVVERENAGGSAEVVWYQRGRAAAYQHLQALLAKYPRLASTAIEPLDDEPLGPGERIVDGERLYSDEWLDDEVSKELEDALADLESEGWFAAWSDDPRVIRIREALAARAQPTTGSSEERTNTVALALPRRDVQFIVESLDFLADVDEGEHWDVARARRTALYLSRLLGSEREE